MTLLEADRDTLFFDFYTLYEKEVPVRPNIKIDLGQNYLMDGEIEISPKNIIIKGPKKEIAEVDSVSTLKMELSDLNSDFETTAALNKPAGLVNTTYSTNSVRVSGKVFRFSEKIIDVPVEVINLPEGTAIRTFPNAVSVLCKARMDILKNLGVADFKVVGDFNTAKRKNQNITVELKERPENLQSAQLLENEVEYILKRE
jgi:YbbR domain-containing protein